MSAVSISVTPSSTARRTTRTPSSRSSRMRIAPKPSRRTSSSPPSMNVGFMAAMLTRKRSEQARRHLEVSRRRCVPTVALHGDLVSALPQTQRNVEMAARVEPWSRHHLPASRGTSRDGDRAAGVRLDGTVEQSRSGRRDLELRRDSDRDDRPVYATGVEPIDRLCLRLDGYVFGATNDLEGLPATGTDPSLEHRTPYSVRARREVKPAAVEDPPTVARERELADVEPTRGEPKLR